MEGGTLQVERSRRHFGALAGVPGISIRPTGWTCRRPAITAVASAIGNAVFDATGVRLRQVPFTPARVLAALSARR